jgi:synovial sarcoma, X breakpoint 2 interacting protein
LFPLWQDVFDLPFHMARDQIEESLRTKMTSIKVGATGLRL